VVHHIFITACAQNIFLLHERKAWTLTRLANSTFNIATQSGSLAVDASFQFVDVRF